MESNQGVRDSRTYRMNSDEGVRDSRKIEWNQMNASAIRSISDRYQIDAPTRSMEWNQMQASVIAMESNEGVRDSNGIK